ncbi:hypothetical protein T484DRAFT_1945846 [Baffinella frigidus]|nr:hypothetical protein T484DRAFT_1945846 [Cryptophyta sp. CCMP2293]
MPFLQISSRARLWCHFKEPKGPKKDLKARHPLPPPISTPVSCAVVRVQNKSAPPPLYNTPQRRASFCARKEGSTRWTTHLSSKVNLP